MKQEARIAYAHPKKYTATGIKYVAGGLDRALANFQFKSFLPRQGSTAVSIAMIKTMIYKVELGYRSPRMMPDDENFIKR